MTTVYYAHGFNILDGGQATLDQLATYLGEWDRVDVDYGWAGLAGVSMCNTKMARVLAATIRPQSIFVGHSNGCAIQAQAIQYGAKIRGVIWIAPSIPANWVPPPYVQFMHVYYNRHDIPIALGTILGTAMRLINRLHPFVQDRDKIVYWGNMGRHGATHAPQAVNKRFVGGHSGLFQELHRYGPEIASSLRRELTHAPARGKARGTD